MRWRKLDKMPLVSIPKSVLILLENFARNTVCAVRCENDDG
jgi:hypothetical protein